MVLLEPLAEIALSWKPLGGRPSASTAPMPCEEHNKENALLSSNQVR